MVKIYHEHVARVMQSALAVFRRYNAGETVSSVNHYYNVWSHK